MFKWNRHMTQAAIALLLVALLVLIPVSVAFAGQPGVECDDFSQRPGNDTSQLKSTGSAFVEGGIAGQHYAGEQPQNSNNVHSVSQYDVACEKVSQH